MLGLLVAEEGPEKVADHLQQLAELERRIYDERTEAIEQEIAEEGHEVKKRYGLS